MSPLRIERLGLWELEIPLLKPFATSAGTIEQRRVGLVSVLADGHEGWGEFSPVSGHTTGTFDEAWSALELAGPSLIGVPAVPSARLPVVVPSGLSALEGALWDIASRSVGEALWRHLGGREGSIVAGSVISLGQDAVAATSAAVAAGYQHVKLKIEPGDDRDRLAAVRLAHPDLAIGADGNGAYSTEDATRLAALDDLGLVYLEQPFPADDLGDSVRLAAEMRTPVCLDEGVHTVEEAHKAIAAGLAVTVKPAALGGLAPAIDVHSAATAAGTPLRVGGLLETGVGRAFASSLGTLPGFSLPSDLSLPSRYLAEDPSMLGWELRGPNLVAPDSPGAGFEIDSEVVQRHAVSQVEW